MLPSLSATLISVDLLFTVITVLVQAQVEASCYQKTNNTIVGKGDWNPCGPVNRAGFAHCCAQSDKCSDEGFCHFNVTLPYKTGYYMSGCTDPNFQDSSCPLECTQFSYQDVVYIPDRSIWSCCYDSTGTTQPNCSLPAVYTFQGPSPEEMFNTTLGSASSTQVSTSTSTTAAAAASSHATPSGTDPASKAPELSGPDITGIVLGALVMLISLVVIGYLLRRRRSRAWKQQISRQAAEAELDTKPALARGNFELDSEGQPIETEGTAKCELVAGEAVSEAKGDILFRHDVGS